MNDIQIVPINQERTESNALYHCDACTGIHPMQWPRWRIEAGLNHGGNTRTMRLCDTHRNELLALLLNHAAELKTAQLKQESIT